MSSTAVTHPVAHTDDLDALAQGLDVQHRSRAIDRILAHHAALRSEIDRLGAQAGEQREVIVRLEKRVAALEAGRNADSPQSSAETSHSPSESDAKAVSRRLPFSRH